MKDSNGQHDETSRFEDPGENRRSDYRRNNRGPKGVNGRHPEGANGADASGELPQRPRSLSEISHLFLSELRNTAGNGRTPPKRIPPGQPREEAPPHPDASLELNAADLEDDLASNEATPDEAPEYTIPPVSALIGARLGGKLVRRACQYAAGLADELPVGLVIVEPECLRLMWVSQGEWDEATDHAPETLEDARRLRAALLEMSCDIARWLVVLPDPRLPQARRMLAAIRDWVLLTAADHEGVVASYRVLKGLCDLELPDEQSEAPHVTLAFVDADDAAEAQRHARKLIGVCKQFLDLQIEPADLSAPAAGAVASIGHFVAREVAAAAWTESASAHGGTSVVEEVLLRRPWAAESDFASMHRETVKGQDMAKEQTAAIGHEPHSMAAKFPESAIPAMARPVGAAGFFADDFALTSEDMVRLERRLDPRKPVAAQAMAEEPPARRHIQDIEIPDLALPVGAAESRHAGAGVSPRRGIFRGASEVTPYASQSPTPHADKAGHDQFAQTAFEHGAAPAAGDRDDAAPSAGNQHGAVASPDAADPAQPAAAKRSGERDAGASDLWPEAGPLNAGRITRDDEVIDLPAGETVAEVVLARLQLAETAITPPMLAGAKLCISREGAIVLVAAAAPGLGELPAVGQAMTWASENRTLLRMALSQFRIDDSAPVLLHLLVSRADANAEALRPLMSTGRVTVQAYRRLTWGGRRGLLLEAA